jgi:hypothetical protein
VRLNSVYRSILPSGGGPRNFAVQRSDVICHLVALRGSVTWACGIWAWRNNISKLQDKIIIIIIIITLTLSFQDLLYY